VLAHSTHVKGLGTYDAATGSSGAHPGHAGHGHPGGALRRINLGYLDPASIRVDEWKGREADGVIVVRAPGRCCTPGPRCHRSVSCSVTSASSAWGDGGQPGLNMERNGFRIAGYDLEAAKGQAFVAARPGRHVDLAARPTR